jgi:hypothetical protein
VKNEAVLEVAAHEAEAELICSLLRTAGIPSMHRMTDIGAGRGEGYPYGPREIVVRASDLQSARKVLRSKP